jgi:ABC-type arginine transport system permease subunit
MHKVYHECIDALETVDCAVYAEILLKMIATLEHAVSECCSSEQNQEIVDMYKQLIRGLPDGISKDK